MAGANDRAVTSAAVPRHAAERLQWLSPAPLWQADDIGPRASGVTQPWIAELTTDRFVETFIGMLAGTEGRSPADLAGTRPQITADAEDPASAYRLFQPLSQRYYLITATLACRRPGIPDHRLVTSEGERVFFVMRQVDPSGAERGLVGDQWLPATATAVLPGEQEYPLHPAPVASFGAPGTAAANLGMAADQPSTRSVFFGYIPVAGRDAAVPPLADPAGELKKVQAGMTFPDPKDHPAVVELMERVVEPWKRLLLAKELDPLPNIGYGSLFLLLDLLDWLKTYVESVFTAITENTTIPAELSAALGLLHGLEGVMVQALETPPKSMTLVEALKAVKGFLALVDGTDTEGPDVDYDLANPVPPASWLETPDIQTGLAGLAQAAVEETKAAYQVPPELQGLIKADPVATAGTGKGGQNQEYVIRAVLVHEPCAPVLSTPTRRFELARALDADAPARPVLLQLPDVNHLRKFNRGVAIEMSPSLRRLLDRVTPEMMKGNGLADDHGPQLGMICSFSLQIIFLVAFIVMFIFLILLNIVFWWLPFLKICFPVPVAPTTPKGPTP
jgi:hypothetical protein